MRYNGKEIASWDLNSIKRFWDFASNEPLKYFTYMVGDKIIKMLSNELKQDHKILDYGAGIGFLSEKLLKKGFNVTSLDSSPDSIVLLKNKLSIFKNFSGAMDLESIKNQDLKFDIIFIVEVVEHLDDYYLNELLENVFKLITDNGIIIITTPNNEILENSYIYCPFSDLVFHRWQHVRKWDKFTLNEKLKEKGFNNNRMIETHFFNNPKWNGFNRKTIGGILEFLKLSIEKKKPHLVAIAKKN
ncbi:hypothetical protein P872_11775 [Rhodonellum psychrophilum GCM71 = DSM 17998]|uniref:Uncharacterized protein n=2 Tax=Rhodonellum TaxID=336827 RepID=U5BTX4_9BACT|nr:MULTISPECIES: class I SAM-dependent methyltransferase [Rhodonellum]ERM80979.1 hypothetical protein P872_11775 [Rhodonellum psychrophilum GCM71 = DSM 17998]SDZ55335.1 Methyltransferase domain-containing protein [Rhodonellum ikkaensis]